MAVPTQPNEGHPFLRFCCVCGWRYFTGAHMDGKIRRHRNGSVLPRYRNYYWNRYGRGKRAAIRNLCFWVTVGFLYGYKTDWPDTKFAVVSILPFAGFIVWRRLVHIFTMQTRYSDINGNVEVYRVIRPAWRRRFARLRPPKIRWRLPDGGPVSTEEAKPMLAENAIEGGAPITSLRRIEEAAAVLSEPRSGRVHTIMRNYRRKEKRSA
jgi:hypothetical protein